MTNNTPANSPTISKAHSIYYFILIGFCVLFLDEMPVLESIFSNIRLAVALIVFIQFFRQRNKISFFLPLMALYWGVEFYSTYIHAGRIIAVLSYGITLLALFMLMQQDLSYAPSDTLRSLSRLFSILIYINLATVILFPNGIWQAENGSLRFLIGGNYNQMGGLIIAGIATKIASLQFDNSGRSKSLIALFIASFTTLLIVGSKTSLVGLTILLIFVITPSQKLKKLGLIVFIFAYFFFQHITVFNLFEFSENGYVGQFVTQVLKKDLSFTARSTIWEATQLTIVRSPIIGHGLQDDDWNYAHIEGLMPHNLVLSILLKGGVLLLGVFIIVFIYCLTINIRNHSPSNFYILCTVWVLAFMMIMEVYNIGIICYLLCLMANGDKLTKKTIQIEEK